MPGSYKMMAAGRHKAKHPHRKYKPGRHGGVVIKPQRHQKSAIVRKDIKLKRSVNYKDKRY